MIYPLPLIVIFLILVCAYLEYNKKMTMNNKVIVCVICVLTLVVAFTFVDKYKHEEENFENADESENEELKKALQEVKRTEEQVDVLNEYYESILNMEGVPQELKQCKNILVNGVTSMKEALLLEQCKTKLENDYLNDDDNKKKLLGNFNYNTVRDICKHISDLLLVYKINKDKLDKINFDFLSSRMSEGEILKVIKNVYEKFEIILDPHTAIGYGAFDKVNIKGNNIVLATAHPCKFPDAIEKAINLKAELPKELAFILDEKENYDIIENNLNKIKQHIKERI